MDNEHETMIDSLLRKVAGQQQQYVPAPGEAAMGIGLVAGIIHRLINESTAYEYREEAAKLRERLDAQQQAQLQMLMQQNMQLQQQVTALLAAQQPQQPQQPDMMAILEAILQAATPAQQEAIQRLLPNLPTVERPRLPAPAARRRNGGR